MKNFSGLVAALSYALAIGVPPLTIAAPQKQFTVDTGYALYIGNNTLPNTVAYLGIPYAEPPTGNGRWRSPVPLNTAQLAKDKKTIDARSYPDFCVQGSTGNGDAGGAGSEDCLKINIYAPTTATPESKLPVLVYIHGGGYVYGNPANWPFDHWIEQSPNVVIVSVYYRLDSIGFLAHPDFQTNPSLGDLNVGFQDQTLALNWVQQHITSFGGDPSAVTINGQSAGASSVELHMVATGEENLFRGAIAQSVFRVPLPTPQQQVPLFNSFASLAGCGSGSTTQKMVCLRKAPVSALAMAQDASKTIPYNVFHPALDGKTFTDYPTRLLQQGKFHHVDVIAGATSNETLASGANITAALQSYFPGLTQADISSIESLYPASEFDGPDDLQTVLTGDQSVRCGRAIISNAATSAGKSAFAYRYNAPVPPSTATFHAAENWMMFDGTSTGFNGTTIFQPQNATEIAFSEELIAYWLSFVRSGNPNTFKLSRSAVWPLWSSETKNQRMVLQEDTTSTSGSKNFAEEDGEEDLARCEKAISLVQHEED